MNELTSLKKKIIYRANYRGTKEMDILLSKFVDKYINSLPEDKLKSLYEFLNLEDDKIFQIYQKKIKLEKDKFNEITRLFIDFRI
jgi:antitoxin CptB|tara:strand:+ start:334 stop:588 length:255 start_codon:yes stop_codon:yes gene_type:complete